MSWDDDYWSYINRHDNFGLNSGYDPKIAAKAELYANKRAGYSNESASRMSAHTDAIREYMENPKYNK